MPTWSYLVAVLVFGLMVLVHELGHYWVGKASGLAVAEFAVGWGPRLFSFRRGETLWTVRALPLGGYVRWQEEGPGGYLTAPFRARLWALFAGPLANLLLAVVLLAVLYGPMLGGGAGALGQALQTTVAFVSFWVSLFQEILTGGAVSLDGPVGIAQATAEMVIAGWEQTLLYSAFMSVNLGLFNLMPVPGFDGGRLLLLGVERLRRRRMDPVVEGWIHASGFLGLTALIFYTTVRDILA